MGCSNLYCTFLFQIMEDPLQGRRLECLIDDCEVAVNGAGKDSDFAESNKVHGLLALVKNNQISDSRRSYQCIKTLVNAANKSAAVKEKLLRDPEKWQWAVNWLKEKMSQGMLNTGNTDVSTAAENSNYWTSASDEIGALDVLSNEDATSTRTFHRTTSAQVILEEANALLAEFGDGSMADNDNSVLMSSIVSPDKCGLHPTQQYDTNSSPATSPAFNRQLAVVPDIDPGTGISTLDQMETDSCGAEESTSIAKTEDSEMPDLINDDIKVPAVPKNKVRSPRSTKGTNRSVDGSTSSVVNKENKNVDWDFESVD